MMRRQIPLRPKIAQYRDFDGRSPFDGFRTRCENSARANSLEVMEVIRATFGKRRCMDKRAGTEYRNFIHIHVLSQGVYNPIHISQRSIPSICRSLSVPNLPPQTCQLTPPSSTVLSSPSSSLQPAFLHPHPLDHPKQSQVSSDTNSAAASLPLQRLPTIPIFPISKRQNRSRDFLNRTSLKSPVSITETRIHFSKIPSYTIYRGFELTGKLVSIWYGVCWVCIGKLLDMTCE